MFRKFSDWAKSHRLKAGIMAVIILGIGYYGYKSLKNTATETRYVLAAVEKGTITASISGSGQVSASQQVEIKAKASGAVISVPVKQGQTVKAGSVLTQLDATEARRTVRDAQLNLETAQLSLEKLKAPADELTLLQAQNALDQAKRELADLKKPPEALTLLQAENALAQAKESKQKAEDNLKKAYDDGFTNVSNAFLDLPTVMTGLKTMFFDSTIKSSYSNIDYYSNLVISDTVEEGNKEKKYRADVLDDYLTARPKYLTNFDNYKAATRTSDSETLEKLISETYETTKAISDTVKSGNNYLDYVQDNIQQHNSTVPSTLNTNQTSLDTYTGDINSTLSSLLSIKRSIQDYKEAITNADRTIAEKTDSLADIKNGADEDTIKSAEEKIKEKELSLKKTLAGADKLDLRSQELSLRQKQNALADANEKLADYSVRAPFDGVVAKINFKKADEVSSGTAVATLITKQHVSTISLNEVDITKIKVGQKAMLTFDAIEELTISGEVAEVDSVGTVSQGVVSYGVKIVFDAQDDRIKPSMSVSASIITDVRQDVLFVPNSAIKTQGDFSYVEMFDKELPADVTGQGIPSATPPLQKQVEIGLSNDTSTEIKSGLNEGDKVVTRTVTSTTAQKTTSVSLFGGNGNRGGGGGMPPPGMPR